MPSPENERRHFGRSEPLLPSPLPDELTDFLKDKPYAALLHGTDQGTVFIVKAPSVEIESLRGHVSVYLSHEVYRHPTAPVIRTVVHIYDQPDSPLAFEVFTNIDDESQRAEFAALASQKSLLMLFYDETLAHRLLKRVSHGQSEGIPEILRQAEAIRAAIPKERFDFDRAKAAVMEQTSL